MRVGARIEVGIAIEDWNANWQCASGVLTQREATSPEVSEQRIGARCETSICSSCVMNYKQ